MPVGANFCRMTVAFFILLWPPKRTTNQVCKGGEVAASALAEAAAGRFIVAAKKHRKYGQDLRWLEHGKPESNVATAPSQP